VSTRLSIEEVPGTALTPPEPPVVETTAPGGSRPRVTGVDVARGLALLGMIAMHVLDDVGDNGPTATGLLASGRSAATFAVLAGVSVAFLSGGRTLLYGRARAAAAAGLAVRALVIGTIGLLLGFAHSGIALILVFYAALFVLAIPLLGLGARALALLAAAAAAVGPVVLVAAAGLGLPTSGTAEPTPVTLVTEPVGLLVQVLVTGDYPVVVYLAYLCAGMAIGRLDLTSVRLAWRLVAGGVAMAAAAQLASWVLLYPLGGMARLLGHADLSDGRSDAVNQLLWNPEQQGSWSYLALASPHAHTQLDLLNSTGSALVVLGVALLLTRIPAAQRLLGPLRAAGTMSLTLYSGHVLVIASGVLADWDVALYLFLVIGCLIFAVLWRRGHDQGPLEKLVGTLSGRVRRIVLAGGQAPVGSPGCEPTRHPVDRAHNLRVG
jgi:uncharacterized membrane protein YeiB